MSLDEFIDSTADVWVSDHVVDLFAKEYPEYSKNMREILEDAVRKNNIINIAVKAPNMYAGVNVMDYTVSGPTDLLVYNSYNRCRMRVAIPQDGKSLYARRQPYL